MVKPLNKEWQLFGHKYRVADAKGDKVDCKACQKQVTAAVNRLQSHMRVCSARNLMAVPNERSKSNNPNERSGFKAGATSSKATCQAIQMSGLSTVATMIANGNIDETNARPVKKQCQSTRNRPQQGASSLDVSMGSNITSFVEQTPTALFNERRLRIEEKRLLLETRRDQRKERRERLELDLLKAQATKEKLMMEAEGYKAKTLLALSRKQLRDQEVSEKEIDRILPITSSQLNYD